MADVTPTGSTPPAASHQPSAGAAAAPAPAAASSGMESNVAGALAYFFGLCIVWLLIEPYKSDKFVRFHSFQAIFLAVGAFATLIGLWIVGFILHFIPILGAIASALLFFAWLFAVMGAAFFSAYKAYSKELFKLPFLGDLAAKQAGV